MVVMRTYHNVLIPETLVFSRKDGDDIMGDDLLVFLGIGEVVIIVFCLLSLERFEFQTTEFINDEFRGEGVAGSTRVSATKFL